MSKIKTGRPKLFECPACSGKGWEVVTGTGWEHDPNCRGDCKYCPVPVPIPEQVACSLCEGEGRIPSWKMKEFICQQGCNNLKTIEELDRLGLLET